MASELVKQPHGQNHGQVPAQSGVPDEDTPPLQDSASIQGRVADKTVASSAPLNLGDWHKWLNQFRQPGPLQIGLMIGAPALVALLVALVLWSGSSDYEVIYRGLSASDAGEIMDALEQTNVPYRVDKITGALTVPEDIVHETRLKLASQGLPRGSETGFELLQQDNSFGVSQFMENARYQRALEGELTRSIASIGAIQQARVHLALPKESVFVRQRQPPSASVLIQLHPGRVLDKGQVAAIVHLVSSSVPKLNPDQVSVIDQAGNLLTRSSGDSDLAASRDQLDYTQRLEEHFIRRIENILTPVLGLGRVRAQVALDLDFTAAEETAELYDSKQPDGMVRSERLIEDLNSRPTAIGIPGALSNQPPGVATVPEQTQAQDGREETSEKDGGKPKRQHTERVRNYELDKRIRHTRNALGQVKRISVAVVLDDRIALNADGDPEPIALTAEELEQVTALVKETVGFNAQRGDTVNIMNKTFAVSPFAENPPSFWQQDWFLTLIKWLVIGVLATLILFVVVRPALHQLMPKLKPDEAQANETESIKGNVVDADEDGLEGLLDDHVEINGKPQQADRLEQLEKRLTLAKALVSEDPKRAVQVINNWLESET